MYKVGCKCCERTWDCGQGPEQKIKALEEKLKVAVESLETERNESGSVESQARVNEALKKIREDV